MESRELSLPLDARRPRPEPAPPRIDVERLLAGANEARLTYLGVEYRLRVTRQGKLLLTK